VKAYVLRIDKIMYIFWKTFVAFGVFYICVNGCSLRSQDGRYFKINEIGEVRAELIYSDDFEEQDNNWVVEQMPGGKFEISDGKFEVEDNEGCTIWFKEKMEGPLMLEYVITHLKEGGPHDRVSDMNCFWMASSPHNEELFFDHGGRRYGKFSHYDSLRLYYVGQGGHHNTRTRFRRYDGEGNKPLLPEHDLTDSIYLLIPNQPNRVRIIVFDQNIQYYRNGKLIYNFIDKEPYDSGYFAFRTVNNHMVIEDFKVYRLSKKEKKL
jgi:hypothetical protein